MSEFDSPITAAAKRMIRIIDTGYLPDNFRRDLDTLLQGALAFDVVTGKAGACQLPSRKQGCE